MLDDILRFPTAMKHDPAIDTWLAAQREEFRPLVSTWFERMRRCGPDVRELMHDGCPTACVGDAAFGYVNAFRKHVNVGFFFGALLEPLGIKVAYSPIGIWVALVFIGIPFVVRTVQPVIEEIEREVE